MWDIAREHMHEMERLIRTRAPDVDMLPKYGELLCKLAAQFRHVMEARCIEHRLRARVLEWMSASSCHRYIEKRPRIGNDITEGTQLRDAWRIFLLHRSIYFNHAAGHFRLDFAWMRAFCNAAQYVGRGGRQVVIVATE